MIKIVTLIDDLPKLSSLDDELYFPNMCHVCHCFGKNANKLKTCAACQMISYCCKQHQIKDWPNHKEFCKVLCQIKKEWKLDNLFQSLKSNNAMIDVWTPRLQYLTRLKFKVLDLIQRQMREREYRMLVNPRVCAVCFESNPNLLTNCEKCPQSSFCEMHKNDPRHENDCSKFISTFYSPNAMFETIPPLIRDLIDMKLPLQTTVEKLPISMTKFFEKYFSNVPFNSFELEKKIAFNSYFSEKYSSPLSILLAMEKLDLINLESMTIHVVGATAIVERDFIDWEIMLHYLPQLRQLKLILIGLDDKVPNIAKIHKLCQLCKNKKQLTLETHKIEYHKYCGGKKFKKPDMIACFNPGFQAYPTWPESIKVFDKGQCPLLITAHNHEEGLYEQALLLEPQFPSASANCVYRNFNPFASLHYKRSYVPLEIYSANGFIFVYKHLGNPKAL